MHGQANVGVANSTLHHQRVAVAAAYCGGGSGDLDVALILAGGSKGKVDPAFAAHESCLGMWAEAVWCSWLPRPCLSKLVSAALPNVAGKKYPWA